MSCTAGEKQSWDFNAGLFSWQAVVLEAARPASLGEVASTQGWLQACVTFVITQDPALTGTLPLV